MRKLTTLILSLVLIVLAATPAVAGDTTWHRDDVTPPNRYSFEVVDDEGITGGGSSSDTATFKFRLSRGELEALRYSGSTFKIDFRFTNYRYADGETEVSFGGDKIGVGYVLTDSPNSPIMRIDGIDPYDLVANKTYTVSVKFRMFYGTNLNSGQPHLLSVDWVRGEWYEELYVGECEDDLLGSVTTNRGTYCTYRYDEDAVELGVHDFGY